MAESTVTLAMRRSLCLALQEAGEPERRATEIVDLAAHGVDRARDVIFQQSRRAVDEAAALSVLEMSAQLVIILMQQIASRTSDVAALRNLPTATPVAL